VRSQRISGFMTAARSARESKWKLQLPIVAVKAAITAKAALIKRLQECQAQ
jgi:hypothetical protein